MKKARWFLAPFLIASFLFPMLAPIASAQSSNVQEAMVIEGMTKLIQDIISYMSSSQFLALVAAGVQTPLLSSDKTTPPTTPTEPTTPTPPAPKPKPKDQKLHDWCVANGGVYQEIPGYDPVCVKKMTPGNGESFYLQVCQNDPVFGIKCADLKIVCPAGNPPPPCKVIIDKPWPLTDVTCTIVVPSQYPGQVQLKCTGIGNTTVDLCYSYDPVAKTFVLKKCVGEPNVVPVFTPMVIPSGPFLPWITPPTTVPPQFLPPGLPAPATPTTPTTPAPGTATPASLQSLVDQLNALINELSALEKASL